MGFFLREKSGTHRGSKGRLRQAGARVHLATEKRDWEVSLDRISAADEVVGGIFAVVLSLGMTYLWFRAQHSRSSYEAFHL